MPEIRTPDATLYCEVEGDGEPVTVLAHGLTNNRNELAAFTPLVPGTKVRFDFRGHGRSSSPATGFRFEDFARDVDAVASAFGATVAVGTSLGAGAIGNLVCRVPDRFERMVWLLPAGGGDEVVAGGRPAHDLDLRRGVRRSQGDAAAVERQRLPAPVRRQHQAVDVDAAGAGSGRTDLVATGRQEQRGGVARSHGQGAAPQGRLPVALDAHRQRLTVEGQQVVAAGSGRHAGSTAHLQPGDAPLGMPGAPPAHPLPASLPPDGQRPTLRRRSITRHHPRRR